MANNPLGPGHVITGSGELLNMDELIAKASRPIKGKHDQKDKIIKREPPRVPLNVRGFRPDGAGMVRVISGKDAPQPTAQAEPVAPKAKEELAPPSSYAGGEARSLADLTGVKLDEPRRLKSKPKDAKAESAKVLGEILNQTAEATVERSRDPSAEDWRAPK
jgi:hypothetical protein